MGLIEDIDLRRTAVGSRELWSLDLTEAQRQRDLLLRGDVDVAEEEHQVVEPGLAEIVDRRVIQRFAEIDPSDIGPDDSGDRVYLNARHGAFPV